MHCAVHDFRFACTPGLGPRHTGQHVNISSRAVGLPVTFFPTHHTDDSGVFDSRRYFKGSGRTSQRAKLFTKRRAAVVLPGARHSKPSAVPRGRRAAEVLVHGCLRGHLLSLGFTFHPMPCSAARSSLVTVVISRALVETCLLVAAKSTSAFRPPLSVNLSGPKLRPANLSLVHVVRSFNRKLAPVSED